MATVGVDIGQIFQAGADTFNTAVNWLMYGQEKQILDTYRQEDLALAETLRQDQLARERLAAEFKEREFGMAEEAFDFGKYKWGQEFGFTKKQYRDQMKRQKEIDKQNKELLAYNMKEHGLDKMHNEILEAANKDAALKDTLLTRYGV